MYVFMYVCMYTCVYVCTYTQTYIHRMCVFVCVFVCGVFEASRTDLFSSDERAQFHSKFHSPSTYNTHVTIHCKVPVITNDFPTTDPTTRFYHIHSSGMPWVLEVVD